MNIGKAAEFIRANGSDFELARLDHTFGRGFDIKEVVRGFSSVQNPDGGFPYQDRPGFPSCLSNTTMALQTLLDMGLGNSVPAISGIGYLSNQRLKDGTWQENPKIRPLDPPFWDMPGDEDTAVWLTAASADILKRAGKRVPKSTKGFLTERQMPDGKFSGFIHTTWIALSLFSDPYKIGEGPRARALRYLEGADLEEWDASSIAWCLDSMKRGKAPGSSPLWKRLFDTLSDTQEEDGGWPSESDGLRVRDANSVLRAAIDPRKCA